MKKRVFYSFLSVTLLLAGSLWGNLYGQDNNTYRNNPVTLKVNNKPLKSVLDTLSKVASVHFFYNHSQLDGAKRVSVNAENTPLETIVLKLVEGMNIDVSFEAKRTIVLKPVALKAADVPSLKVKGKVIDVATGEPLPGASVVLSTNRTVGVVTDIDGNFSIEVPQGMPSLVISFVGYQDETLELSKQDLTKEITIKMITSTEELEDVVVTGMAPRKAEGFTGRYVSVKGEELKRLNPTNVLSALQMFDPGFRIVENNKMGSDPNTMPEFQLRGDVQIGASSSSSMKMMLGDYSNRPNMPLFILDGFEATLQSIVDLDVNRIESVTILKDASAKAIYGSRAANGVIVFETRKPLSGALNISYSSNYSLDAPDLTVYNLMDAAEKLDYERRAGLFPEENENFINYYYDKLGDIQEGVDTYWLSEPVQVGFSTQQNIQVDGGDDAFRYNLGLNYDMTSGVMKGSDRKNLGVSTTLTYRRKKWNVMNSLNITSNLGNNSPYGSYSNYAAMNPYYKKRNDDGTMDYKIEQKWNGSQYIDIPNPLYDVQWAYINKQKTFSVSDNFSMECAILENLRVQARASFTKTQGETDEYKSLNRYEFSNTAKINRGSYNKGWANSFQWTAEASVNYNLLKDKHSLFLSAHYTMTESTSNSITLLARGFPNDNMNDIHFAYQISKEEGEVNIGEEAVSRSLGVTGVLSYLYDDRYAVDFTVRGDLSSQFGTDTGMAPFWSAGFRWNAHREKFIENLGFISNLVLTANIGITGQQNYSAYQSKETYSFNDFLFENVSSDVLGAQMMAIGNPALGWSTTRERSMAVDVGFLQNRITASFTYYNNYTDEMLEDYNVAPSTGFTTMKLNIGAIQNTGYEWNLNFLPINNYANSLQWSINLNGSFNDNVVKELSNEIDALNEANRYSADGSGRVGMGEPLPLYEEGRSTDQLWVVRSLGIDPMSGKEVFLKRDGTRTFTWDAVDKVPVGREAPKMQGNFGTSLIWKNFTVSLNCLYSFGAWKYNQTLVNKIENANITQNVDRRAAGNRWEKPGDIAKFKRISATDPATQQSSRFVEKENYFQFSSVSLGYRLDAEKHDWMRKMKIASINLNSTFNDLGRISTIKMERGTDYPFARTFNLSLSVLFN